MNYFRADDKSARRRPAKIMLGRGIGRFLRELHEISNHLLIYFFDLLAVYNYHMRLEDWNAVDEKLVLISDIASLAIPNHSYVLLNLYVRLYLDSERLNLGFMLSFSSCATALFCLYLALRELFTMSGSKFGNFNQMVFLARCQPMLKPLLIVLVSSELGGFVLL